MKALKEIGFKKTLRFLIYSLLQIIYNFSLLPPVRRLLLISFGAKIGSESIIMGVKFFNWYHKGLSGFRIGRDCFIGDETLIDLYEEVIVEDQVTLAQRVLVLTHTNVGYKDHPLQKYFPKKAQPVVLKTGCFIGAGSIILPGVTIGKRAFITAGSVVSSDIPSDVVYGGVPAKFIRKLK